MAKTIVIVGPTGAGKSGLAIALAQGLGAEVLSADSQQVYRGMDIGTGKVSDDERQGVVHHLIDIADPSEEMTAAKFLEAADRVRADADARGVPLIVAGGTMLYVRVLLRGIFPGPPADPAIRSRLEAEAEATPDGGQRQWERLRGIDPEAAGRIDKADRRRVVRALEVFEVSGKTITSHHERHDFRSLPTRFPAVLIGVAPDREKLYERINGRVDQMLADGLIAEVERLREAKLGPELRSQQAIGYGEIHRFLDGEVDLEEAVRLIKRNSRRYARRQLSWYRRDTSISWYEEASNVDLAEAQRYLT